MAHMHEDRSATNDSVEHFGSSSRPPTGVGGREYTTSTDPALNALITSASGGVNPVGFRDTRRMSGLPRPAHNPYINLAGMLFTVLCSLFAFFVLEAEAFGVALALGVFGLAFATLITVITVRRIPAWHRARRVALGYVKEHGGQIPSELRIWS